MKTFSPQNFNYNISSKSREIRSNQIVESSKSQKKERIYPTGEGLSPRGRRSNKTKYSSYNAKVQFRDSSSRDMLELPKRNRAGKKDALFYSEDVSEYDLDETKFNTIRQFKKIIRDEHLLISKSRSLSNSDNSFTNKNQGRRACSCCKCSKSGDDENQLPREIYEIIYQVYNGHIVENNKIEETVANYQKNVQDFCTREKQQDILYLVRLFIEKVIEALQVIRFNNKIGN